MVHDERPAAIVWEHVRKADADTELKPMSVMERIANTIQWNVKFLLHELESPPPGPVTLRLYPPSQWTEDDEYTVRVKIADRRVTVVPYSIAVNRIEWDGLHNVLWVQIGEKLEVGFEYEK